MSLERRKCVKRNEDLEAAGIEMKAFSNYSQESCLLECRARLLFDKCGCLPYYYPDFAAVWNKDTVCTQDELKCLGLHTCEQY